MNFQSDSVDHIENSITLNLPAFGTANPRVWFTQLEAFFRYRRITSQETMFSLVTAHLPNDIASEVIDIIDPMPTEQPYTTLKAAILKRTTVSDEARLPHLLSGLELGDRLPSQLLRHMRSLAGNFKINDTILRQLWCKCLPSNTNAILSTQEEGVSLDKLAEMADKVHECFFSKPNCGVNVVKQETSPDAQTSLMERLSRLELKIDQITRRPARNRRFSRSSSRHRPHRSPQQSTSNNNPICYFHRRFKHKARKCEKPCTFKQRSNMDQGNSLASQ